jgi:hypothetical protein
MVSIKIITAIALTIEPYYLDKWFRLQPWRMVKRFKGSDVDFSATLTNEIDGEKKKRDGISPEPFNPDRPNVQLKGKIAVC